MVPTECSAYNCSAESIRRKRCRECGFRFTTDAICTDCSEQHVSEIKSKTFTCGICGNNKPRSEAAKTVGVDTTCKSCEKEILSNQEVACPNCGTMVDKIDVNTNGSCTYCSPRECVTCHTQSTKLLYGQCEDCRSLVDKFTADGSCMRCGEHKPRELDHRAICYECKQELKF